MKSQIASLLTCLMVVAFAAPAIAQNHCPNSQRLATKMVSSPAQDKDIVATAIGAGKFKTLAAALGAADLVETMQSKGPFTVFAPTDAAFAKLPKGTVAELLKPENKTKLQNILKYHVVPGRVMAADVVKLNSAKTVLGQPVTVKVDGDTVMIDGAKVTATDIKCSNGVIHIIDSVILPAEKNIVETAVAAGKFKTLAAAAGAADLVETLSGKGPFTVFAPTDEAFAKLPEGTIAELLKPENKTKLQNILKYHVVAGSVFAGDVVNLDSAKTVLGQSVDITVKNGNVMVDGAKVIATDIKCNNGVIHIIDSVILPKN